jgi:hypothetical protein
MTTYGQSEEPPNTGPRRVTPGRLSTLGAGLRFADKTFRDFWFYVAAAFLVLTVTYTLRPQLSAQVAATSNDNPLDTLYTLSNVSAWTLQNVSMKCEIWDGPRRVITLDNNSISNGNNSPLGGNPRIAFLKQGESATRDCGTGGNFIDLKGINYDSIRINLIISYDWLWDFRRSTDIYHFNTRERQGRIFLVPDVEGPTLSFQQH